MKVTNLHDSGEGSLRQAVTIANEKCKKELVDIEITVDGTLTLTSGPILVKSDVCIHNACNDKLLITTSDQSSQGIFTICSPCSRFQLKGNNGNLLLKGANNTSGNGGAISCTEPTNQIILQECVVSSNVSSNFGGGIYTRGSVILVQCLVLNNSASSQGGGIWAGAGVTAKRSSIDKNLVLAISETSGGGGIYVDQGNVILSDDSSVSNNSVSDSKGAGSGGGIIVNKGGIFLEASHVDQNVAYNSAGIQQGIGNVYISKGSTVNGNRSFNSSTGQAGGGGITIIMGTVEISASKVSYNETKGMYSGGIVSFVGDVVVTSGSTIRKNSNCGPGGGIACNFDSSVFISGHSSVTRNKGSSLGGGIVNFTASTGVVSVSEDSTIDKNILTDEQTIGQTIKIFLSVITNHFLQLQAQAAKSGGVGGRELCQVLDSILASKAAINTSTGLTNIRLKIDGYPIDGLIGGAGIATLLTTSISLSSGSIVSENKTVCREGLGLGGGIFALNGPTSILNSFVSKNSCSGSGGGIWNSRNLVLNNSTIEANNSGVNGGGIYSLDSESTFIKSMIKRNSAEKVGGGIFNKDGKMTLITDRTSKNTAQEHPDIYSNVPFTEIKH